MNMAHLKVLKTDSDYRAALHEAEILVERDPQHGSEEADRLELLTLLIETFEEQSFPIDLPDPIDAIEFRMEEQGLRQKDLVSFIGSRSRVSEVLSRKRPLTIPMIRALSDGLGIPLEALVAANRKSTIATTSNHSSLDWNKFPFREMDKRGWFDVLSSRVNGSPEEVIRRFLRKRQLPQLRCTAGDFAAKKWTKRVTTQHWHGPREFSFVPSHWNQEFQPLPRPISRRKSYEIWDG